MSHTDRSMNNDCDLRRFALAVYALDGVPAACVTLQDTAGVDVTVLLCAAFAAHRGRQLTGDDVRRLHDRVDAWHREVVEPLRTVRRRLTTGPAPAPAPATADLRRRLQELEIDAEMIELDVLDDALGQLPTRIGGNVTQAMYSVVSTAAGRELRDEERRAVDVIADAVAGCEVVR